MEASKTDTKETPLPEKIGDFPILRRLGQGGMGEVFLAKDLSCDRLVAIKRIRPDLAHHEVIRNRFLKEANITASLFHQSIIPVYSVHNTKDELYYVMPYVEGETLKTILRDTVQREKSGDTPHPIGISIASLLKIFVNICQAMSYCHSRGILHRDLKPENILVGNFGQVLIFDWGLAGRIGEKDLKEGVDSLEEDLREAQLTSPGKVLGTLCYMPPERMDGRPADEHTDLYSLGVILYQLLTLRMPFHRKSIKTYRKWRKHEELIDALEAAPFRDIPPQLAEIAKRCLAPKKKNRYHSIKELMYDLERYKAGLPDWIFAESLDIHRQSDWEFQENVLLSKLVPITRSTELMNWHMLMISKHSFSGNKKIDVAITLQAGSEGVGFMLNVPEPNEREGLEDGYLLWIGSKKNPGLKLYRSYVNILEISEHYLDEGQPHRVEIEKTDHNVRCFINGFLVINFRDSLPIIGTHVGLLCSDMEFTLSDFSVFVGSQNAMVGCLSIPDAFLASKNFDKAIEEYERIAESFASRAEGNEAIFRKGIALIEKAKHVLEEKEALFAEANETFDRLHGSSSEPLEYLGKSLVYGKIGDLSEETKCLELGMRKFKKSSLLHLLEERIMFRLHESAKNDRRGVYNFALLCLRYLPHRLVNRETHALIHGLSSFSDKPSFLIEPTSLANLHEKYRFLTIELAFWMDKPLVLKEILEEEEVFILKEICRMSLDFLGHLNEPWEEPRTVRQSLFSWEKRLILKGDTTILHDMDQCDHNQITGKQKIEFDLLRIWAFLLSNEWDKAEEICTSYDISMIENTTSPIFMLYGCILAHKEGFDSAMQHLSKTPDYVYPPAFSLLSHFLKGGIGATKNRWMKNAFTWEKICLYSQLSLFYHCLGESQRSLFYRQKILPHNHPT